MSCSLVRPFPVLISLTAWSFLSPCFYSATAAVVTSCDEAGLRAALAAGNSVTFGCDGTIVLSNAISLTRPVSIDSAGHNVSLSGGGKVRIFEIGSGGVVRLTGLTLTNGFSQGANGAPAVEGRGGAILVNEGQLHATDCSLLNNLTVGGAGVEFPGAAAYGGAIFVTQGTLRLTNCSLMLNTSRGGTGGSTPFIGTEVKGGDGYGAAGSARNSDVIVVDSDLGGNRAEGGDSGFVGNSSAPPPGSARGGAWHQVDGTSTFVRSSFRTNVATVPTPRQGGGVPSNAAGNHALGGGLMIDSGTCLLQESVFESNKALGGQGFRNGPGGLGDGGAIYNNGTIEIRTCVLRSNSAVSGDFNFNGNHSRGGGIHNLGSLLLRDSLVDENSVLHGKQFGGGSTSMSAGPGYTYGGGLWNGGTANLVNSSFTFNSSQAPGAIYLNVVSLRCIPAFGGGIFNTGQLTAVNVTLSGNAVRGGDAVLGGLAVPIPGGDALGGGIYHTNGSCSLTNVTAARNESAGGKGTSPGARLGENLNIGSGGFSLVNSIVANEGAGSNCVGVVTDGGHNISSDSSCQFTATGSLNNYDPKLGPLGDYTGPTPTMPLLVGSPAIDTADSASCPPTDQRGRTRPSGAGCDIGAFESSAPYSVFGHISGWAPPQADIQVWSGTLSTGLGASGNYILNGFTPGTHSVVPSSPSAVFIQSNAVVTVGPDTFVNFHSYRSNAVTLEMNSSPGTHRIVFAGETGRTYILSGSSDLPTWTPLQTNVVSSSQIFDYFETDVGSPAHRLYKVESP